MAAPRVLDLDLDFFLNPFTEHSASPRRLGDEDFTPWKEAAVRDYLEKNCGLKRPIPGCVAEKHDAAVNCWKGLLENDFFDGPFEVVHVDAHSDLGGGDPCFEYLHEEFLHLPIDERTPRTSGPGAMHEGNYLAFALALRWISRVDFVFNSDTPFCNQFPEWAFKDWDFSTKTIQLKKMAPNPISPIFGGKPKVVALEPEIPCDFYTEDQYSSDADFDFLFLAKSPGFTPPASDLLIPVIEEYMEPI